MKLPKTTLILLLLALGLGGFVYFYEIKGANHREEVKQQQQEIFSFTPEDVQAMTIKTKDITLQLEKRTSSAKPQWLIKSPISEPANDAIVSYLMDLLVKGKSEKTVSTSTGELSKFGLDKPQAKIDIKLKNQQTHQLILGNLDFNNNFLYAQVDPIPTTNENINLLLVSKDFANAVNRQLSEWRELKTDRESQPLPSLNLENLPKK
ncbi:DUF4340 domain-containing protein [Cronbergia sp. UHCC 0137]|uniref:DUF4340 domain-containing protein n=1 Tax=Cronbergia sp. UHCC 0137 TaxID=3110239 RepID=UPI002B1EE0C5|nr:DUF4340 domain-containing protein [Cronbergia sp. UHCC 0137]MEA5619044.1 DUF4340 domain-containing protein [Cronbergia sp. UHCC 0137]